MKTPLTTQLIPVGLIQQAYAGTPIEGWMPWEIQKDDPRMRFPSTRAMRLPSTPRTKSPSAFATRGA